MTNSLVLAPKGNEVSQDCFVWFKTTGNKIRLKVYYKKFK